MADTKLNKTPISDIDILVKGICPKMLTLSVASVLAGTGAAALRGNMEFLPASLCLIFALLSQMAGSTWYFSNEYKKRQVSDDDDDSTDDGADNIPMSTVLREAAITFLIMDAIVGLSMLTMAGPWTLIAGVAVGIISFFTFGRLHTLPHSPWGWIATFFLFGPVCVIGTTLMQSGHEAETLLNLYDLAPALYVSVAMGVMAVNCAMVYNVAYDSPDNNNPRHFTLGRKLMLEKIIFLVDGFVWIAAIALLCMAQNLPNLWIYMLVPTIVFVANCAIGFKFGRWHADSSKVVTIVNINMLIIALAILVVSLFVGATDDSSMMFF